MRNIILILKHYKYWKHWRMIKRGEKPCDWKRGCGYYFIVGLLGYNPVGEIQEHKMESGKIGLWELISYETYRDPRDMIKESYWHFVGYKDEKPLKECTFPEYLKVVKP